jgi:Protein of unknown function (DUF998)
MPSLSYRSERGGERKENEPIQKTKQSSGKQSIRGFAWLSLLGSGCVFLTVLLLHFTQPDLNPLSRLVSEYALGKQGWLLTVALMSFAVSALALAGALAVTSNAIRLRIGIVLLVIWGLCAIFAALFHTDPIPPRGPLSLSGTIHTIAANIGFFSLTGAILACSWHLRAIYGRSCRLARKFAETVRICVKSQNWRIYAPVSQLRTGLVSWLLCPLSPRRCLRIVNAGKIKVTAADPSMIRGKWTFVIISVPL